MNGGAWQVRILHLDAQSSYCPTLLPAESEHLARESERHWWHKLRGQKCLVELVNGQERLSARSTLSQLDLENAEWGYAPVARRLGCQRSPLQLKRSYVTDRPGVRVTIGEYEDAHGIVAGRIQYRTFGNGRSDAHTFSNDLSQPTRAVLGAQIDWLLMLSEERTTANGNA